MKLDETLNLLKKYPNGELVARRMAQLHDFTLQPENEVLADSASHVIGTIVSYEEKLLKRTQLQMFKEGSLLKVFKQAMNDCTDKEWEDFKKNLDFSPLESRETSRLLLDASGLVKGTGFEGWVLGESTNSVPVDIQIMVEKGSSLRKK